tara:strand:+ start:3042 stop:3212 length:171 start_codon:yes stop_codon:yes gene_type:complete
MSETDKQSVPETYSWRLQLPIYACAFFAGGLSVFPNFMFSVLRIKQDFFLPLNLLD